MILTEILDVREAYLSLSASTWANSLANQSSTRVLASNVSITFRWIQRWSSFWCPEMAQNSEASAKFICKQLMEYSSSPSIPLVPASNTLN